MLNLEMFSNPGSYLGIIPVRAENENVIFSDLFPEVKYAQKEKDQIEQLLVNIGIALTGAGIPEENLFRIHFGFSRNFLKSERGTFPNEKLKNLFLSKKISLKISANQKMPEGVLVKIIEFEAKI
jgi:hypothetical protein